MKEIRMTARENDSSHERRLRRTVAELSECTIDDIEAIWSALSHGEREQLRPLLAEAARVAPDNLAAAGFANAGINPSGKIAAEVEGPAFAKRMARLGESLPNELLSRLLFSLEERTRDAVIDALPPQRRALLVREGHASRITERARVALRNAALSASAQPCNLPDPTSETLSVKRPTLRAKMRRWIGRPA
jgi:hypothetical protein